MKNHIIKLLGNLLLFACINLGQQTDKSVNCYEQYCLNKDSGWVCQYSGNGRETEFMDGMFCYEDQTKNEKAPETMSRIAIPPWYYDDDLQDHVQAKGHKCKNENSSGHEYCLCNSPLCNNKLKLPEVFKVDKDLDHFAEHKTDKDVVFCYHQYCLKRDFGWVCIHSGNGKKTKLLENEYCSEFRSENEQQSPYILRSVSSLNVPYDKEFMDSLEKDGHSCQFNKTPTDFCLCNKSLCNTEFGLPGNFTVDTFLAGSPEGHGDS